VYVTEDIICPKEILNIPEVMMKRSKFPTCRIPQGSLPSQR